MQHCHRVLAGSSRSACHLGQSVPGGFPNLAGVGAGVDAGRRRNRHDPAGHGQCQQVWNPPVAQGNQCGFRDALQQLFGVTVTGVRTMQMRRNAVMRGKTRGTTARWKKAIVTLKDGDSIAVFEG